VGGICRSDKTEGDALTILDLEYGNGLQHAAERARKDRPKSKREQAADKFNEARKLAREALEEESAAIEASKLEAAMVAEYGPRLK
jgi:hypothetical protein